MVSLPPFTNLLDTLAGVEKGVENSVEEKLSRDKIPFSFINSLSKIQYPNEVITTNILLFVSLESKSQNTRSQTRFTYPLEREIRFMEGYFT